RDRGERSARARGDDAAGGGARDESPSVGVDAPRRGVGAEGQERAGHGARARARDRGRGESPHAPQRGRAGGVGPAQGRADDDALESTRPTHDDTRARIAVARGLAGHTDQANARTALLLVLGSPAPRRGHEGDEPENGARLEMSRRIAALALAQSRDSRAVDSLVALARATG